MSGEGKGKGWGKRRDDQTGSEEKIHQYRHSLESGYNAEQSEGDLMSVEMDALVFLQIMKHCRQHAPQPVTGQLLGMDVGNVLQLTHSFGYVQKGSEVENAAQIDEGVQFQMDTLRKLREVNVDSNTVGWYQTTHLGQFINKDVIHSQHGFQTEIPRSVLVVYDSLQAAIGKPSFKALQLTKEFMEMYGASYAAPKADLFEMMSVNEMFVEIPIVVTASPLAECFLLDWSIMSPLATSQVDTLDVENQAFFEKNVQLLSSALANLAEEQQKMAQYERNAGRKGDDKGKGKGGYRQAQPQPLDTMVLSKQIQNYCKAINNYAGDAFSKVYLVSNKPKAAG
mmetsp:Transcript_21433/g.26386  ORF Transcript_21433/g.26386 Transcript_21433/m.26386 type:complete len:339 (-) Transcript_21433:8-1024(-)